MWCWYRQVTLTANAVYFLIAWPGGVREGRAAFATVSALPSHKFFIGCQTIDGAPGISLEEWSQGGV